MTSEAVFPWAAPAEHERAWITIELDYPTDPWEYHLGGELPPVSAPRGGGGEHYQGGVGAAEEDPRDQAKREEEESDPVDRVADAGASIRPGWAEHIEFRQYWIHLTLYRPVNERWQEKTGEGWMEGELVNDGIVERGVSVEATTDLGRRALRIIEALHSAHPYDDHEPQKLDPYPWG